MTENASEPASIRSSDHQFLFRKTDRKPHERAGGEGPLDTEDRLSEAFPDMLGGRVFLEKAMARVVAEERFGALVMRADAPEGDGAADRRKRAAALAGTLRDVCAEAGGLWGRLEADLFGCILPGGDGDRCRRLAEEIQETLGGREGLTATIGLAAFPTRDFPQNSILDNARKALEHADFFGPGSLVAFDAVSLNISGDRYYQEGDVGGAVAEFTKALSLDPDNVNVHNSLGVCYGVREEYDRAAASFETASRLDPTEPMAVYNLGLLRLMADGGREEALRLFLKAHALGEDIFEVAFQIGKLYLDTGQPEAGREYLEKAAALRPTAAVVQRYLGEAYRSLGMTAAALSAYRKAVKQNPNDAEALSALGMVLDHIGENCEVAETFCRHSVAIAPENGLFRHRLGQHYLRAGDLERALEAFRKASELGHDSSAEIDEAAGRTACNASGKG